MTTDFVINKDTVEIVANGLNPTGRIVCQSFDIELRSPDKERWGTAAGGFRRALVHYYGDTLEINFANDYKGGVVINGDKVIVYLPATMEFASYTSPTDKVVLHQFDLVKELAETRKQLQALRLKTGL